MQKRESAKCMEKWFTDIGQEMLALTDETVTDESTADCMFCGNNSADGLPMVTRKSGPVICGGCASISSQCANDAKFLFVKDPLKAKPMRSFSSNAGQVFGGLITPDKSQLFARCNDNPIPSWVIPMTVAEFMPFIIKQLLLKSEFGDSVTIFKSAKSTIRVVSNMRRWSSVGLTIVSANGTVVIPYTQFRESVDAIMQSSLTASDLLPLYQQITTGSMKSFSKSDRERIEKKISTDPLVSVIMDNHIPIASSHLVSGKELGDKDIDTPFEYLKKAVELLENEMTENNKQ